MKKKKKSGIWGLLAIFLVAFIIGVGVGMASDYFPTVPISDNGFIDLCANLALFIIGAVIHVLLHEAGHLIFGLMSGYKFSSYRIFNLMFIKTERGIELKRHSIAGTLGQCLMSPPPLVDGRIPVVLYNLGGSIMNFVLAAISFLLYIFFSDIYLLSPILGAFALSGVILAASNAIPISSGGIDNDGKNVISLLRDPLGMRSFWVQLSVTEQLSRGKRLKDMPEEWFVTPPLEEMNSAMSATIGVYSTNRLVDMGSYDEALSAIDVLLSSDVPIIGLHKNLMICDKISLELIRNPEYCYRPLISNELTAIMKSMKSFPTVIRTEYIIKLLGEGNRTEASLHRDAMLKTMETYPYPQDIESELEIMDAAAETFSRVLS